LLGLFQAGIRTGIPVITGQTNACTAFRNPSFRPIQPNGLFEKRKIEPRGRVSSKMPQQDEQDAYSRKMPQQQDSYDEYSGKQSQQQDGYGANSGKTRKEKIIGEKMANMTLREQTL
jgi:hypothetical protein